MSDTTNYVNELNCRGISYDFKDKDIGNYYTKAQIDALIEQIQRSHFVIVESLPETGLDNIIYLVPKTQGKPEDGYTEYIYISNKWEIIGSTQPDLSNYYTKAEITALLSGKQDTLTIDTELNSTSVNPAQNRVINTALGTKVNTSSFNEALLLKADKTELPTKTSELTNDSNFAVDSSYNHTDNNYTTAEKSKLATISENAEPYLTPDWSLTEGKNRIENKPTKLSDFTNDSNFITNSVNNLTNYYLKSETYTKDEVAAIISAIEKVTVRKVTVLPETGETNVIYLVPKSSAETQDVYDEYIWVVNESVGKFEKIGNTQVDLSGYVKTSDVIGIDHGGTGQTTAKGGQYALLNSMNEVTGTGTYPSLVCKYDSPSATDGAVYEYGASLLAKTIKDTEVTPYFATKVHTHSRSDITDFYDLDSIAVHPIIEKETITASELWASLMTQSLLKDHVMYRVNCTYLIITPIADKSGTVTATYTTPLYRCLIEIFQKHEPYETYRLKLYVDSASSLTSELPANSIVENDATSNSWRMLPTDQTDIDAINAVIPSDATSSNKLVSASTMNTNLSALGFSYLKSSVSDANSLILHINISSGNFGTFLISSTGNDTICFSYTSYDRRISSVSRLINRAIKFVSVYSDNNGKDVYIDTNPWSGHKQVNVLGGNINYTVEQVSEIPSTATQVTINDFAIENEVERCQKKIEIDLYSYNGTDMVVGLADVTDWYDNTGITSTIGFNGHIFGSRNISGGVYAINTNIIALVNDKRSGGTSYRTLIESSVGSYVCTPCVFTYNNKQYLGFSHRANRDYLELVGDFKGLLDTPIITQASNVTIEISA